jgi:nitronate monooxygenase
MTRPTLHTPLCDILDCEYPIMLAGMGGDATSPELVAAVCNAGGFGVKGMTGYSPEEMDECIREIRSLTDRPFGVDLLLPVNRAEVSGSRDEERERIRREYPKQWAWAQELYREYGLSQVKYPDPFTGIAPSFIEQQIEVIMDEDIPVFAAALGDPGWLTSRLHAGGRKVIGLVGNIRNAVRQVRAGVDMIAAQGYEAGGHVGRIANFPLIPQVVDAVNPMPVLAAGAIADGRGVAAALSLGAIGVWVGTAFLVAEESRIPYAFQQQILNGTSDDFIVTRAYTGKTARDYRNEVIDRWEKSGLEAMPMPLQGVLMQDFTAAAKQAGRWDLVNNPSGQIAGALTGIKPAKKIVEDMVQDTIDVLQGLSKRVTYSLAGGAST